MHGTLDAVAPVKPAWFPDWSGEVCAIIASGPSVEAAEVAKLKGRCRVAVVNNNHELAPWADVLYAADGKWWDHYPKAREFAGLKVTPHEQTAKRYGLNLISLLETTDTQLNSLVFDKPGLIGRGGNSAFQLINLVLQFGARRLILVGFDFTGEHWHGEHPRPLNNPRQQTLEKWSCRIDEQAGRLKSLGVEVMNASPISTLLEYPKADIETALRQWGC